MAGRRELGGLGTKRDRVLLVSTTHGAETRALAASLETLKTYQENFVIAHMRRVGEALQEAIRRGRLIPFLVLSFSRKHEEVRRRVVALGEALGVYKRAVEEGAEKYLVGRPVQPVFRKRA